MKHSGISLADLPRAFQEQAAAQMQKPTEFTAPVRLLPLTLWLDYKVPSLNRILGQHWTHLHREKHVAELALKKSLAEKELFGLTAPLCKIHLVVTMYRRQPIDPDNSFCKAIIDRLRYEHLLRNDDPGALALTVQQVKVKTRKEEGTRLTLTEAVV